MPKVLLNSETGRAAGVRSGEVRRERSLRSAPVPVQQALSELEREFTRNNLAQLRRCDRLLSRCRDPELFVKLTAAKERLYNLTFPRPGVRKPKPLPQRPPLPFAIHTWEPAAPDTATVESPLPDLTPAPASPSMTAPEPQELAAKAPAQPAPLPPVSVDPVPAQIAPAPPPKLVFASEPVEIKPQRSGPKIYQPHELGAMVCGIGPSRKS